MIFAMEILEKIDSFIFENKHNPNAILMPIEMFVILKTIKEQDDSIYIKHTVLQKNETVPMFLGLEVIPCEYLKEPMCIRKYQ